MSGDAIRSFAERHRVKVVQDENGESVVVGRRLRCRHPSYPAPKYKIEKHVGHIYEHDSMTLGLMVMPRRATWPRLFRKLLAQGFTPHQNGDWEGSVLFPAGDMVKERTAMKAIGVRIRRKVSPERLEALKRNLELARQRKGIA